MQRRPTFLAWIAAIGVLAHVGTAGASTWCKTMGLLTSASSCCPTDSVDHARWEAPTDCCKPALEPQKLGAAQAAVDQAPCVLQRLPWDRIALDSALPAAMGWEPEEVATSPPLVALASIVIVR